MLASFLYDFEAFLLKLDKRFIKLEEMRHEWFMVIMESYGKANQ